MEKSRKLLRFRDFLQEEFEDKQFEKEFYNELGKARIALEIAYYREKAGLTQSELASKMKTSQSNIARLENPDYQKYSISLLRKIADVLDLELVVTFRKRCKANQETSDLQPKDEQRDGNENLDRSRLLQEEVNNMKEELIGMHDLVNEICRECRQINVFMDNLKSIHQSTGPQRTVGTSPRGLGNPAEA
jgi:transcriptional regulator with XRE-family HTH domain